MDYLGTNKRGKKTLREWFDIGYQQLRDTYVDMRANGVRKEDARFLLPNMVETRLVMSGTLEMWRHFVWLRALDTAAQWEIRNVGQQILRQLYQIFPGQFEKEIKKLLQEN